MKRDLFPMNEMNLQLSEIVIFLSNTQFLKSENVIRWPLNIVAWHIN